MTQCERVLQYMEQFGSISTMQAFSDLGVTRLASRIHDLKRTGIEIETETVASINRFGDTVYHAVYRRKV